MMKQLVAQFLRQLALETPEEKRQALINFNSILRNHPLDATSSVEALGQALHDPDIGVIREAANCLAIIAQYRRGDISNALKNLAKLIVSEDQEIRKITREAIIEAAENGPGIGPIVSDILPYLSHKTKNIRAIAATALAANWVDSKNINELENIILFNDKQDVRERALGYLSRGAKWKDISFSIPLVCKIACSNDADIKKLAPKSLQVLDDYLTGVQNISISPEIIRANAQLIFNTLDSIDNIDAQNRELQNKASLTIKAALSPADIELQIHELESNDPKRASDAAYIFQLASNLQVNIQTAVSALIKSISNPNNDFINSAIFALTGHFLNQSDWESIHKLLLSPQKSVRKQTLIRIDLDVATSCKNYTPIVGAVGKLLKDHDDEIRERAASTLRSFTMFGNASNRTNISSVFPELEKSESEASMQALTFGKALERSATPPTAYCMHGSPYDPETGTYLCGKC